MGERINQRVAEQKRDEAAQAEYYRRRTWEQFFDDATRSPISGISVTGVLSGRSGVFSNRMGAEGHTTTTLGGIRLTGPSSWGDPRNADRFHYSMEKFGAGLAAASEKARSKKNVAGLGVLGGAAAKPDRERERELNERIREGTYEAYNTAGNILEKSNDFMSVVGVAGGIKGASAASNEIRLHNQVVRSGVGGAAPIGKAEAAKRVAAGAIHGANEPTASFANTLQIADAGTRPLVSGFTDYTAHSLAFGGFALADEVLRRASPGAYKAVTTAGGRINSSVYQGLKGALFQSANRQFIQSSTKRGKDEFAPQDEKVKNIAAAQLKRKEGTPLGNLLGYEQESDPLFGKKLEKEKLKDPNYMPDFIRNKQKNEGISDDTAKRIRAGYEKGIDEEIERGGAPKRPYENPEYGPQSGAGRKAWENAQREREKYYGYQKSDPVPYIPNEYSRDFDPSKPWVRQAKTSSRGMSSEEYAIEFENKRQAAIGRGVDPNTLSQLRGSQLIKPGERGYTWNNPFGSEWKPSSNWDAHKTPNPPATPNWGYSERGPHSDYKGTQWSKPDPTMPTKPNLPTLPEQEMEDRTDVQPPRLPMPPKQGSFGGEDPDDPLKGILKGPPAGTHWAEYAGVITQAPPQAAIAGTGVPRRALQKSAGSLADADPMRDHPFGFSGLYDLARGFAKQAIESTAFVAVPRQIRDMHLAATGQMSGEELGRKTPIVGGIIGGIIDAAKAPDKSTRDEAIAKTVTTAGGLNPASNAIWGLRDIMNPEVSNEQAGRALYGISSDVANLAGAAIAPGMTPAGKAAPKGSTKLADAASKAKGAKVGNVVPEALPGDPQPGKLSTRGPRLPGAPNEARLIPEGPVPGSKVDLDFGRPTGMRDLVAEARQRSIDQGLGSTTTLGPKTAPSIFEKAGQGPIEKSPMRPPARGNPGRIHGRSEFWPGEPSPESLPSKVSGRASRLIPKRQQPSLLNPADVDPQMTLPQAPKGRAGGSGPYDPGNSPWQQYQRNLIESTAKASKYSEAVQQQTLLENFRKAEHLVAKDWEAGNTGGFARMSDRTASMFSKAELETINRLQTMEGLEIETGSSYRPGLYVKDKAGRIYMAKEGDLLHSDIVRSHGLKFEDIAESGQARTFVGAQSEPKASLSLGERGTGGVSLPSQGKPSQVGANEGLSGRSAFGRPPTPTEPTQPFSPILDDLQRQQELQGVRKGDVRDRQLGAYEYEREAARARQDLREKILADRRQARMGRPLASPQHGKAGGSIVIEAEGIAGEQYFPTHQRTGYWVEEFDKPIYNAKGEVIGYEPMMSPQSKQTTIPQGVLPGQNPPSSPPKPSSAGPGAAPYYGGQEGQRLVGPMAPAKPGRFNFETLPPSLPEGPGGDYSLGSGTTPMLLDNNKMTFVPPRR